MKRFALLLLVASCGVEDQVDDQLGQVDQEVVAGSFTQPSDTTVLGGGVIVEGASLSGFDGVLNTSATITISGIPAGSTVASAKLYWGMYFGTDTTASVNGASVTGTVVASGNACGGAEYTLLADVTSLVTSNGSYVIAGLPSNDGNASVDTNGAALVVTYTNAGATTRRRVAFRHGLISTDAVGDDVFDTFNGPLAPLATTGRFHIIAGDGQSVGDGDLTFNGALLGTDQFSGSDGALWDARSYDVSIPSGMPSATWRDTNTGGDCLVFNAAVLDYTVGVCGDNARTGGETCEQGNTTSGDGCSAQCVVESGWNCTNAVPAVCTPICGDGKRLGGEVCDDGNTLNGDGCNATCSAVEFGYSCNGNTPNVCTSTCGDGLVAGNEMCDDGDTTGGDGCSATCTKETGWSCTGSPSVCSPVCGDGHVRGGELCDDGDTTGGDGCSATCTNETGWSCTGDPSVCTPVCGDELVTGGEACDDGGTTSGDGCSATCTSEPGWSCTGSPSTCVPGCGDGLVVGGEMCDDGNTTSGDGCSMSCTSEPGYTCTGAPSTCVTTCGDGVIAGDETCDDGGTAAGDGCSASCTVEPGWSCDGAPSACTETCGDGRVVGDETCDDGNTTPGDGCSATCTTEPGYSCDGAPSTCAPVCGDGQLVVGEACDDGNTGDGDGCSSTCAIEDNFRCDGAPTVCTPLAVAGGGCAAGGGDSGIAFAGVVVALALAARRRRRLAALAGACGALALAAPAHAQVVSGSTAVSAERFRLTMDRDGILATEAARTPGHLVIDVGLWLGYANDPITVRAGDDHDRAGALVHDRFGGDLVASLGLGSRFELGLAAPVILSQSDDLGSLMTANALSSAGLGDLTLTPKLALVRGEVDVALAVAVTLPTSGGDNYLGEDGVTVAPTLLLGRIAGRTRVLANLGYRARGETEMAGLAVDDELFARVGVGVRAGRADVMLDAALATAASTPLDDFNRNYAEVRAGLGVDLTAKIRAFAAGGVGVAAGYGTPDWRGLVGLWFGTGKRQPAPAPAPVVVEEPTPPPPPAPTDDDGDGIVGAADKCPAEPETKNRYQDDDGCPDTLPDTDGDHIVDAIDKCPQEAEDQDSFDDDDGCPEADNDGDGVLDAADACPIAAGPRENRGCPDTDRDGDTVVDRLDNCPDEPGTVANSGCKDKQLVVFKGDKIELLDVVYFDTNKATLQKRSNKLLDNVAKVINAHAEITKVTIEGHTDDRGDDAKNKDLSQRRAQAVVTYLVGKQVKAELLEPIGYGEDQPIQSNRTEKGRAANRRVEFKVVTGAAQP